MKRRVLIIASLVILGGALATALIWRNHQQAVRVEIRLAAIPPLPTDLAPRRTLGDKLRFADQVARTDPAKPGALAYLANLYQANGYAAEAEQVLRGLAATEPREPRWPHRLGVLVGGFGRLEESISWLNHATALEPDYAPTGVRLGDAQLKLNSPSRAATAYRRAAEHADSTTAPYIELGLARCALATGDEADARARLLRLTAEYPDFGAAWSLLATLHEHIGDAEGAAAARAKSVSRDRFREVPDPWIDQLLDYCYDAYALAVAADTRASAGDKTAAYRLLQRAHEIAPQEAAVLRQLGTLQADLGEVAQARESLEQAVRLAPREADGWAYLIAVLKTAGDTAAQARTIANGLALNPQSPSLHLEYGRLLASSGQLAAAAVEFENSILLRPAEPGPYVELAGLYFKLEQVDTGVARLETALEKEPGYPVALSTLAMVAISRGDKATARRWLAEIARQPKVPATDRANLVARFTAQFGESP